MSDTRHPNTYTIVVRKAIEAWILAGMGIPNAEDIDDPDKYLDNILRREGKIYVKSFSAARKLVDEMNLQQATQNSRSLSQFIKALRDP